MEFDMNKTLSLSFLALALLAACSSPSRLVTPDGRNRTSVNSKAAIDAYNASVATVPESTRAGSQITAQLEAVNRDIAAMKAYMTAVAIRIEETPVASATRPTTSTPRDPSNLTFKALRGSTNEMVRVGDQSIIFRVTFPVGETTFSPSPQFIAALLSASRAGQHIDIRAGSDSNKATPINEKVVRERAEQARKFLAASGIPADRMKTRFFPAGAFVADNSTAQGKARNRRTEVEVTGVGPAEVQTVIKQLDEVLQ